MSEHVWLTIKEVREYSDAGRFDRFVADWREMRKLHERLIDAETPEEKVQVWDDINVMLEMTADD